MRDRGGFRPTGSGCSGRSPVPHACAPTTARGWAGARWVPTPGTPSRSQANCTPCSSKAGIEGPYVLVGHSFGGMYMQTYAARYPDEVAGVALVDSSTDPDQFSQRPEARDSYEPQKQRSAVVSQLVRLGVSLPARLGVVRLLSKLDPASPELPQQQREQIDALTPSTRQWSTSAREFLAPTQTLRLGSPGSLGNKPLAVVTAGEWRSPVGSSGRTSWPLSRPQQHPPCREGGDARIIVVRAERRASDQRGHR